MSATEGNGTSLWSTDSYHVQAAWPADQERRPSPSSFQNLGAERSRRLRRTAATPAANAATKSPTLDRCCPAGAVDHTSIATTQAAASASDTTTGQRGLAAVDAGSPMWMTIG